MAELSSQYNPKETEDKWYSYWLGENLFSAKANPNKKPFCIVIPPPNVTGILHMGHALNNTIQDILIRYHKMKGEETLWMPGTDHAGIATQNVVEKSIAKEGLRRQDLGREKFLERVWQWREQYGATIISQLKKLGASCDWERTRFTMDEDYSKSVIEVFVRLYEKGLIYRGSYIINWCPRCQTALSDEEAPYQVLEGKLYYIKYPLRVTKDEGRWTKDEFVVVATTRPETMLGDTAVAVNPKDRRYKKLIGQTIILPLVNREIKIIADPMVDTKFGTGAVKVTPAHDPNDYQLGHKHSLEFINVMNPDGSMNENAGAYKGMDRFKAREAILKDLEERKLLEKIEPYQLSAGHCYRCHTIIEPYLSKQWFVKMKPLAKPAIEAVKKGEIKFHPKRWTKVYLNWMENIKDWCISRQIWWGHRIPVYYCQKCQETGKSETPNPKSEINPKSQTQNHKQEIGVIVSNTKPEKCPVCGSADIYQDEDVLDTWFSSWLWPFATFYPPSFNVSADNPGERVEIIKENFDTSCESGFTCLKQSKDLKYFYPTSVLVTAPEIIFFWVARMIMAGFEFMGKKPFGDVYIHGTVRDITGKKMSKSLGNIIDPLEIIQKYGTDALRFSLISMTSVGQDIFLSEEKFESGRNFANKIWNASRFILMNLKLENTNQDLGVFFQKENLNLPERWILSDFYETLQKIDKSLANFKFNEAANLIYEFFWHKFCDWYLEIAKLNIQDKRTQLVLYKILEKTLRILHPFMPFITEEIWQKINQCNNVTVNQCNSVTVKQCSNVTMKQCNSETFSIMTQPWPHLQKQIIDKKINNKMQSLIDIVVSVRNLRSQVKIAPKDLVNLQIQSENKTKEKIIKENEDIIKRLSLAKEITFIKEKSERLKGVGSVVAGDIYVNIPLEGIIDIEKERQRLSAQIKELENLLTQKNKRLSDKMFLSRAPKEVVEAEKEKFNEMNERLNKTKELLNALS